MGYYVDYSIEASFKVEDAPKVLAAINALHTPERLAMASGCRYKEGKCVEKWYSWVDNPPQGGWTDVETAIGAWRFNTNLCEELYWLGFDGSKCGDEEFLFEAIAPWLEGEIYARGEDGYEWGYRFKDGCMTHLQCEKIWTEV